MAGEHRDPLGALLEEFPEHVYFKDVHGRFTRVSRSVARFLGRQPQEILGSTDFDFYSREDAEAFRADELRIIDTGQRMQSKEERCQPRRTSGGGADGLLAPPRWFLTTKVPLHDASGKVIGIAAMSRDVTHHKLATEALRESEARFRALAENSRVGFWHITRDGHTIYLNPSMCAMLGVTSIDDLSGRTFHQFFTAESLERMKVEHAKRAQGVPSTYEVELLPQGGGSPRNVLISGAPMLDDEGKLVSMIGTFTDFTERKQAELALQRSEQRFRSIFESGMIGIHFWDRQGNVTEANDAYLRMVGSTRGELEARRLRWRDITPPEHRDRDDEAIEEMQRRGVCTPFEKEYMRADSTRMPILLGAALLADSEHEGVAFALDLTELKRAERELRRQRQEQETILDTIPSMVWYKDRENRIIRANKAAAASVGMTKEEIEGRSTYELYPNEADAYHRDDLEVIRSGQPKMGIVEPLQLSGGLVRWIRTDKIPYRDERGETIGVIVFATDITELKSAEDALRLEQYLLQTLMDNMPDAIYFKDRDSRFLRTNNAHARIMGLDRPEQAIGFTDERFFQPEDAEKFRADELKVIESGQSLVNRVEHHPGAPGTGPMRWWSTTKVPIRDATGGIAGIAGITRDITAMKRAEEEIRQLNERLEQRVAERTAQLKVTNQRLRSLASELSLAEERERRRIAINLHDQIGQSLALLQIKLELTMKSVEDPALIAVLRQCVDIVRQPILDTRALVSDLSPTALYDLGFQQAVAQLVDDHASRHGVQIELMADEAPKPLDEAVRIILFRATRELLVNLVKHSGTKAGVLTIRTNGNSVEVSLADEGEGFDASATGVHGTTSGFGLFSIREQMERLGGKMAIESSPGRGCRVTLIAPLSVMSASNALGPDGKEPHP
jgi:PAS domain S-box-containing protein